MGQGVGVIFRFELGLDYSGRHAGGRHAWGKTLWLLQEHQDNLIGSDYI